MASKAIIVIIIAVSIVCVFTQTPVKLDERHLRVSPIDNDQLPGKGWQDSVPGLPGKDYPNLTSIPETSFSCEGKTPGGYYADVEARCQVFHVCSTQGSKSSFLCPSGSIFNQRHFVCDWWYDFECHEAPELYALNESLDEPEEPSSVEALHFNTLGSPSTDLSLASSGYTNNLREQANLLYEDYAPVKTLYTGAVLSKERAATIESSDSGNIQSGSSVRSTSSRISNIDGTDIADDNHSRARQKQSAYNRNGSARSNGFELNELQPTYHQGENNGRTSNYAVERQSTTYLNRPSPNLDIVPRGFSKNRKNSEQTRATYQEFKRNDQNPGFFINNGLSNGFEESKYKASSKDNRYVEYDKSGNKNNDNNYDSNYDGRYQNYYKNSENNSLPQTNDNYSIEKNNVTNNSAHNNKYITTNINDNNQQNNYYENYYNEAERSEINYNRNLDASRYGYDENFEASTANPQSFNPTSTEDDVDRERQREVDSVDLKRKRPQQQIHQRYNPSAFLIKEETTYKRQDDLSTSNADSEYPPILPRQMYSEPNLLSTLVPEVTTLVIGDAEEPRHHARERTKYLGRRPAGGLPSGSGNGLPGANKILVGSDSVTGKPGMDDDSDQLPPPVTDTTGIWHQSTAAGWGKVESTYVPSQVNAEENTSNNISGNNNDYHDFEGYGQYTNNAGSSWNGDRIFHEQY